MRIFAADVRAADLSGSFVKARYEKGESNPSQAAIRALSQRLPLGNTNMMTVIDSVRAKLVGEPQNHSRSIVYIGDGTSIDAMEDEKRFGAIVDALRADRIAIHSIAIGPAKNVELMAVLANQTGGVVGVVGTTEEKNPESMGRQIGSSAIMSPIWLSDAKWINGMASIQQDRLPPLRLDRDTIVLGTVTKDAAEGSLQLTGVTSGSNVSIVADGMVEASHPDFAFLPGLVKQATDNRGLTLPTASSGMLRETARVLSAKSEELVRAGNLALQQGNRRGAKAVAEKALEADPNNAEALTLERITGNRLVVQNQSDNLDNIFNEGAGDENPFGETPADSAPNADNAVASDPFDLGDEGAAAPTIEAPPAPPAAAPIPPTIDTTPAPPVIAPKAPPVNDNAFRGAPVGDDEILEQSGDLLDRARLERRAAEGRLRNSVTGKLREAHRRLRINPTGVAGSLKGLLATVESTPDINPQLRQELESQVRSAIRTASQMEAEFREAQATLEQVAQGASASAQLLEETYRREDRLKTLSEQMNALIDEGEYERADNPVAIVFSAEAGDTITNDSVAGRQFRDVPLALQTYARDERYRKLRERNFVDAFSLVLKSNIPFVDEPPIQYPEADVWIKMSRRRLERYGAIELIGDNETERRIQATLNQETTQNFEETPLVEAIRDISEAHDIPIVVDTRALEEIGLTDEEPITIDLANVSLRSFLRLMLREFDLTYMIKDEVMQITTTEQAEQDLINKVYPVGDLVVPILSGGGQGGGQGGGGGIGGGGGGGGGFGGGGGGGGGGFGGGGGGGQFAVPDDVSLATKKQAASAEPVGTEVSKPAKLSGQVKAIQLDIAAGQSFARAWDDFFAQLSVKSPAELANLDQRIKATVRLHSTKAGIAQGKGHADQSKEQFGYARDVIAAAIRSGNAQTWMYHAYALSLQATDADTEEVERALLSAVDFAETPEDLLHVAARLEEIGSDSAAMRLCKQVAAIDRYRREPYVMGLRIAKRIDRVEEMIWATEGILSQAWPEAFQAVVEEARLVARATQARLIEEGRQSEANKFNESLKQAVSHDVIVRVSWTGDADIDLAIEEPSGTVCSIDNPTTAGGGTLIGDAYPGSSSDKQGTVSETYICPKAFSGRYRLLVRRVWGNVSTGKATVELVTDVGRPSQRFIRQQLPLTEKDALVVFEVKEGQRKQEIADAQLAHLQKVQRDLQGEVLGQFIGGNNPISDGAVLTDLFRDVQALNGGTGGGNGFFGPRRSAVGFQPQITTLNEGAQMGALAIISADRRYVRISPFPFFSQIGDVTTFNFVTGAEGGGGGGGGGGIGGGGGGGIGGGGGGIGN